MVKSKETGGCCCSDEAKTATSCSGCTTLNHKQLRIEYLYLDLNTCDRCIGTESVLDEVVKVLRPALSLAGYEVEYEKIEIKTPELAAQYNFVSSPTIRVNGSDIFGEVKESNCGCCGKIAGTDVDCRVYEEGGKTYEVPTKEMLANAILQSRSPLTMRKTPYVLPENLKRFFDGKKEKN